MKFKVKLSLSDVVISENIIDMGMLELPGIQGRTGTHVGNFTLEWHMLDTPENNKLRDEFLEMYPTREAYYG